MGVKEKALSAIRRERMLSPDCAVVAGVSGGADSVTLLHVLVSLQREGILSQLEVVHIDHGLRGEESQRDRRFVEDLCRRWNVPLHIESYNVSTLAAEQGKGIEETGRELRYAAFQKAASRFRDCRIATAHTADDNVETLLLHLCRGSGLHGASGIPPVRGNIIRPLITCTREEIEDYCAGHELCFVTDSSNADERYARNRIRRAVMPQLKQLNPHVTAAMTRFIEQARQTDRFLETLTAKAVTGAQTDAPDTYCRQALLSLEEPIRSRALCRIVKTVEERHVRLLLTALEEGRGAVVLPTGVRWTVTETALIAQPTDSDPYPDFCFPVKAGSRYVVDDSAYQLLTVSRTEYEQKLNIYKYLFQNALDYDRISGDLILRQRREGDRFHPAGRNCGKSLKKLFNEGKTVSRDTVPILCDKQGILMVPGFGCDERVRITPETATVLLFVKEEDVL